MTPSDRDIDDLIREALGQDEAEIADALQRPSITGLLTETFRGLNRRMAVGGVIANALFFIAGIVSGVRFLRADDQRSMLLWATALLLCFGVVTAIKIWYWLEMHRLAVTREVKRVELRVAQLAKGLGSSGNG